MAKQRLTEEVELGQESYPVCCIESASQGLDWPTLIGQFLDYQRGIGRAESTVKSHAINLQYWTGYLATQSSPNAATVTPQVAAGYQAYIYQYRTRYGKPFALQTQIGILNSLRVFYKYLLKTGKILANPAAVIQLPREPRKLPGTILTAKEMKRLLKQPDTATVLGFRDRTMYEVLYSTGLRISELIGMRVEHIVPPSSVPASAVAPSELWRDKSAGAGEALSRRSEAKAETSLFIPETKYFKDRYAPLGATARRYLAEYLDQVRPLLLKDDSETVVFLSRIGRPMHKTSVWKKLKIYGQRAGIDKHLTVHVFRHTLATEMLRRGADLRQIQELLGHRNLRTTQIYTHIVKGELRRVQAHCHPREQVDLPDGFTAYRGRDYLTADELNAEKRNRKETR